MNQYPSWRRACPKLRLLAATLIACLCANTEAADDSSAPWKPLAYAQLTAEKPDSSGGIDFDADRVRAGIQYQEGALFGGILLDFAVDDAGDRSPGTLTNVIKDVYVGWQFDPRFSLKLGQFKTPVGMDFNTPGHRLDITKRGLEKPLVLERDPGLMLSARNLGSGLGFDIGVFNPAGRSGATRHANDQSGESNAYAARVLLDRPGLHLEASVGGSEDAAGLSTPDYQVYDLGAVLKLGQATLKAEWISGRNILGMSDREQDVGYAHIGYRIGPQWEAVLRHYDAQSRLSGSPDTDLANTYLGFNFWPLISGPVSLRLQMNYVIAGGDRGSFTGLGGYRDDAVLAQLQLAYP